MVDEQAGPRAGAAERLAGLFNGDNPNYPVQALARDLQRLRDRVEKLENDDTSPDGRMSDDMNGTNPATTDALIQLMLGGLPTGRTGFPLHCRLRYFDPARQRAAGESRRRTGAWSVASDSPVASSHATTGISG